MRRGRLALHEVVQAHAPRLATFPSSESAQPALEDSPHATSGFVAAHWQHQEF
jgi:hypothetical protein